MRTTTNMRTTAHLLCLATVLAIGTQSSNAGDDVLYDALLRDVVTKNLPYSTGYERALSFIGGANVLGESFDTHSTDDFELASASVVTSITIDISPFLGTLPPIYLVEFYEDESGTPSETPFATATISPDHFSWIAFNSGGNWGNTGNEPGYRLTLDLGDGVTLGAGTWWVSPIAVDDDDWQYALFRQDERATGGVVHIRGGGMDHGNNYPSIYDVFDWAPFGEVRNRQLEGDLAMRIEGHAACTADLTGDGALDFFDVSAFLSAFTAMDPAADFTGDGMFDFFDVSAFLNAFTAGCP